ncbi:tripartite motif-containing protein 16-like [Symphorus nematophorus]
MADSQELLDCSICLQLLEDPVTIACGHSYCMKCINTCWDENINGGRRYSCPQCRQTFYPRPVLKTTTVLANLLEERKRETSENAADGDDDVQCNACTGRKTKASMFCCVCLASYCEHHLKPHFAHNLIPASARIKESICGQHDKIMAIYCRTDQQFICLTCVMGEHKDHDTVEAAEEKCKMQRIRAEMREKVREAETAGVNWINSHLEQLQREVLPLRRREDQLNQLSLTVDPIQFLQGFWALGDPPVFTDSHESLDRLTEFVTAQQDKLKNMCNEEKKALFSHPKNDLLSTKPNPSLCTKITSRTDILTKYKYSKVELDPNTVTACLCLSDGNRALSWGGSDQAHPDHPDRFTFYHQALGKNGLTKHHYWEVEWDGGIVDVAVSYKGIQRKGSGKDCSFGHNNLSWKLFCSSSSCMFWHNGLYKGQIAPACSRRLGVCLDYEAGILGFYSVSEPDTLTLLHQIQTTFTEPLYPGFSVNLGSVLKICNI